MLEVRRTNTAQKDQMAVWQNGKNRPPSSRAHVKWKHNMGENRKAKFWQFQLACASFRFLTIATGWKAKAKDCNLQWARLRGRPRQVRRLMAGKEKACSLSNPVPTKRKAGGLKPSKVPRSYISRKSRAINKLGGEKTERIEHVLGSCWHCLLFYQHPFFPCSLSHSSHPSPPKPIQVAAPPTSDQDATKKLHQSKSHWSNTWKGVISFGFQ